MSSLQQTHEERAMKLHTTREDRDDTVAGRDNSPDWPYEPAYTVQLAEDANTLENRVKELESRTFEEHLIGELTKSLKEEFSPDEFYSLIDAVDAKIRLDNLRSRGPFVGLFIASKCNGTPIRREQVNDLLKS
jgi:hypothetical protein